MTRLPKWNLPGIRPASQLWLAMEFNGFMLKAALVQLDEQTPVIIDLAFASEASVNASFEAVVAELKSRNNKLPESAILTTTQSATAIVDIPSNLKTEPNLSEIQEMVQWEFEQQLCEQCGSLTLDTVLVGRELLEESMVDRIRHIIRTGDSTDISLQSNTAKFATKAVELGLTKKDDIEASLRLLAEYFFQDDEPITHCLPLPRPASNPNSKNTPWLVGGMGKNLRTQWVNRFASAGFRLERIYSQSVATAGCLKLDADSSTGIITLLDGLDCYAAFEGEHLTAYRWGPAPLSARNPEALINLVASDPLDRLWISGTERVTKPVVEALKYALDIPVATLPAPHLSDGICLPPSSPTIDGVLGSIRHYAKQTDVSLTWVHGADPAPPWWRQASQWWRIAAGLVALFILVNEASIAFRKHPVRWALKEINDQITVAQSAIAEVNAESREAQNLAKTIEDTAKAVEMANTMANLLTDGLSARQVYTKGIFIALAKSVTPNVAVNTFQEDRDHFLMINAWALTEKEAQEFIRSFANNLSPWNLSISQQQVRRHTGRLGLAGYSIELELKPNPKRSIP